VESVTRVSRFSALRKRRDIVCDLGVASTVGTIMSLLVFLAFLSLFTTQYIPVWMTENEAKHGDDILTEMACIRQSADLLILSADRNTEAFCALKLGADGVPVFAAPTAGILSMNSREPGTPGPLQELADASVIEVDYNDSGSSNPISRQSAGRVQLYMPNRYFVQQWYSFENGGIVLNQSDGEWLRVGPHMRVERSGNTLVNMSFRIMTFVGKTESKVGVAAEGVKMMLMNEVVPDEQFYGSQGCTTDPAVAVSNRSLTIIVHTNYQKAWVRWFDSTLAAAGLSSAPPAPQPCAGQPIPADYTISQSPLRVTVTIRNLSYFSLLEGIFSLKLGEET
jgi:hypothetical protein